MGYVLRSLAKKKMRTSFTVLGISLAIALTMTMFSLSEGIDHSMRQMLDDRGIDLFVMPGSTTPILPNYAAMPFGHELADSMYANDDVIASAPRFTDIMYLMSSSSRISGITAVGIIPEREEYFGGYHLTDGQWFETDGDPFYETPKRFDVNASMIQGGEVPEFTQEIVVDPAVAQYFKIGVGDVVFMNRQLPVDKEELEVWVTTSVPFEVVGIQADNSGDQGNFLVWMHLSEAQFVAGKIGADPIHRIYLRTDPGTENDVKDWITSPNGLNQNLTVYTREDVYEQTSIFTSIFDNFALMVVWVTIGVSLIFIATIMMMAVRERSKEIGLLRVIGISRLTIMRFVVSESLLVSLMGLVVGMVLGKVMMEVLNVIVPMMFPAIPTGLTLFYSSIFVILRMVLLALLIGTLAGLVPALWSISIKPVEVVRSE